MFDRLLCKWIHKKDITVGDIVNKLVDDIAMCGIIICIISIVIDIIVDPILRKFCLILLALICLITLLTVTLLFGNEIINKIAGIKVASCPLEPKEKK